MQSIRRQYEIAMAFMCSGEKGESNEKYGDMVVFLPSFSCSASKTQCQSACMLRVDSTRHCWCMLHCSGLRSQRFPLGCSVQWRAVGRMIHCAHVSQVTRVHWTTACRAARRRAEGFSSSSKLSLMSVSSECRSDQSTSCNETKGIGTRQGYTAY